MSDEKSNEETAPLEQAVVKRKKGISPVWILPIVAALIGGWLLYKGVAEAPIEVVINFETGEGITAGKTKVMYKGLNAGVVKSLKMNHDLKSVDVTVDFDRRAKPALLSNTEFTISLCGLVTGMTNSPGDSRPSPNLPLYQKTLRGCI